VDLVDTATQQTRATLQGQLGIWARDYTFSPDGNQLATWLGGLAVLWEVVSGKELARLDLPGTYNYKVHFSPDGRAEVASLTRDHWSVWDLAAGRQLLSVPQFIDSRQRIVAFSPDGRRVAEVDCQGTVQLWDSATGENRATCPIGIPVHDLAFTPDGRILVGCYNEIRNAWDDRLRGWFGRRAPHVFGTAGATVLIDVSTGALLTHLRGHSQPALLADGKIMATYDLDRDAIRLWDLPPRRAIHPALAWAALPLTVALTGLWWRLRRKTAKMLSEASR
jgi:WD40 repeat protein